MIEQTFRKKNIWASGQIYEIFTSALFVCVLLYTMLGGYISEANKTIGYIFICTMVPILISIVVGGFLALNYIEIGEDSITFSHICLDRIKTYKFSDIESCKLFRAPKGPTSIIIKPMSGKKKAHPIEMVTAKQIDQVLSELRSKGVRLM